MDPEIKDEELIAMVRSGKPQHIAVLYEKYKLILLKFFYNQCRNQSLCEDLVQITFEKVIRYSHKYQGVGSFKSWLFSIARNVLKDEYYRSKKQLAVREESEKNNVTTSFESGYGDRQLLELCLDRLSNDQRELLTLTKLDGMSYEEVGELLGLTVSNIKIKIFRIMNKLRMHRKELINEYPL